MARDFVAAVRSEIAALEADLAVRHVRLRELRKILVLYSVESNEPRQVFRQSPERAKVLAEVRHYVGSFLGNVVSTRNILAHLAQKCGIEIGGRNPINSLSAILSTSKQFRSHGRSGWTLLEGDNVLRETELSLISEERAEIPNG